MATSTLNRTSETSIASVLLQEFEQELGTTRRFLERIPEEKLNWRPHAKSMTAGELALHIAQVPAGVLEMSLHDETAPPDMTTREAPQTLRDVSAALDRSTEYVRKTLPTIDDRRMRETFTISKDGKVLMSVPRAGFLRAIMFNHWYHHRGQLGVYLRLLGAKVPSSYGPSGDESPFSMGN
jgi:uncharacterized damage-inducible protein DinB